jgi:hypothetical protein
VAGLVVLGVELFFLDDAAFVVTAAIVHLETVSVLREYADKLLEGQLLELSHLSVRESGPKSECNLVVDGVFDVLILLVCVDNETLIGLSILVGELAILN